MAQGDQTTQVAFGNPYGAPRSADLQVTPARGIQLGIVNGFRLRRDGEPLSVPLAAQRLMVFLALQQNPVHRLYVASMLRTDTSEERATASLRTTLWRLGTLAGVLVSAEGSTLALASGVCVDLREITTRARSLIQEPGSYSEEDLTMLAYCGDVLPDWYEDWLQFERERARQLRLHALEALSAALLRDRRFGQAAEAALAAVGADPLRESSHRALISVHLAEGNAGEALSQYRTVRRLLGEHLGIAPSPAMEALFDEQAPGLTR